MEPNLMNMQAVDTIELKPDYPNLCRWFVQAMADHSFVSGSDNAVASFMEIVRYLQTTDPQELDKIIKETFGRYHRRNVADVIYVKYCDEYNPETGSCPHGSEEWRVREETD